MKAMLVANLHIHRYRTLALKWSFWSPNKDHVVRTLCLALFLVSTN